MSQVSSQASVSRRSVSQIRLLKQPIAWFYAFWKFSRPHTIIGTSLSVLGLYLIAIATNRPVLLYGQDFLQVVFTLLACLCGNVYIVGLNQLEDVAIDRVNKPHLPLASGEFSQRQAITIIGLTGTLAILLATLQSWYLLLMVGLSLLIGTAYSLPPIRLKRFPFWASLCIFTVRGVIVNLGLFLHFNQGGPIPNTVWTLTAFILVFTFAIAIFKDIPDAEGDRRYNITTFTLQLGQQSVFNLARWVLTVCYLGMVLAAGMGLTGVNAWFLIGTHLLALGWFWIRSLQVSHKDKCSVSRFYQFIWKLFFIEYLVFPIACLLS